MTTYDVGQVCLNGHEINSFHREQPELSRDYCPQCGAKTITACPQCGALIRGGSRGGFNGYQRWGMDVTPYCPDCGKPYPWTEELLKAAEQLAFELEELTPHDRELLAHSWEHIIAETPQSEVTVLRVKKLLRKVSPEIAKVIMAQVFKLAAPAVAAMFTG